MKKSLFACLFYVVSKKIFICVYLYEDEVVNLQSVQNTEVDRKNLICSTSVNWHFLLIPTEITRVIIL